MIIGDPASLSGARGERALMDWLAGAIMNYITG